jgi:hypothetical protein
MVPEDILERMKAFEFSSGNSIVEVSDVEQTIVLAGEMHCLDGSRVLRIGSLLQNPGPRGDSGCHEERRHRYNAEPE